MDDTTSSVQDPPVLKVFLKETCSFLRPLVVRLCVMFMYIGQGDMRTGAAHFKVHTVCVK